MTEKRFNYVAFDGFEDNGEYITPYQVCELLNELHSRNKRLEEKIQRERTSFTKTHERWSKESETKIKELSEENEELKKQLNAFKPIIFEDVNNGGSSILYDKVEE